MKCPLCKEADIVEEDKIFRCENQSSENQDGNWVETGTCTFKAIKNSLERFGGEEVSLDLLQEIAENGEAKVDLVSKAGKPYTAFVILDEQWGIKVDFDRPREG